MGTLRVLISFPNSSPDPNLVCPCWFLCLLQNQNHLQTPNQNQFQMKTKLQQVAQRHYRQQQRMHTARRQDLAILLQEMSYMSIHIYWRMHLRAWRRAEIGGHAHIWADGRDRDVLGRRCSFAVIGTVCVSVQRAGATV